MLTKILLLFTIVGTVLAELPRRVHSGWDRNVGDGSIGKILQDGDSEYLFKMRFKWDLDINCANFYLQTSDYE